MFVRVCVCVCVCVIHVYIDEHCGNMGSKTTRSLGKFNIGFHGVEIRNRRIQSLCSSSCVNIILLLVLARRRLVWAPLEPGEEEGRLVS